MHDQLGCHAGDMATASQAHQIDLGNGAQTHWIVLNGILFSNRADDADPICDPWHSRQPAASARAKEIQA